MSQRPDAPKHGHTGCRMRGARYNRRHEEWTLWHLHRRRLRLYGSARLLHWFFNPCGRSGRNQENRGDLAHRGDSAQRSAIARRNYPAAHVGGSLATAASPRPSSRHPSCAESTAPGGPPRPTGTRHASRAAYVRIALPGPVHGRASAAHPRERPPHIRVVSFRRTTLDTGIRTFLTSR